MSERRINPTDPMFKPLTMREVLEITGRSRRTIEKWVQGGLLTKYEQRHPRVVVFNEDDVVEAETERAAAARENQDRIRRRGGRPGSRTPQQRAGLDGNRSDDASLA